MRQNMANSAAIAAASVRLAKWESVTTDRALS